MISTDSGRTGYPSVDKPWLKYYTEEDRNIKLPECTVFQNIYDRNKDYLDDIALCFYGNKISFRMMFAQVELCAKTLRAIGIKKGECVNLCTASVPESVYIVLACSRIGAIANFINPLFEKDQMKERINDTEAEWIIILDAMYEYIKDVLPETCIKKVVLVPATNSVPVVASKILYFKSNARKILKEKHKEGQDFVSWKEFLSIGENYIETAVNQCKVVNVRIDDRECLVAHIVLRDDVGDENQFITRLHDHLKATLPSQMVPEYYKIRESMPVHSNGKRDVGALKKDKENLIRIR